MKTIVRKVDGQFFEKEKETVLWEGDLPLIGQSAVGVLILSLKTPGPKGVVQRKEVGVKSFYLDLTGDEAVQVIFAVVWE